MPSEPFLPKKSEGDKRKTLVLDLDETLVHSSFKPVFNCDIILPIEVEGVKSNVYVQVRPGTYEFLD